MRRLFSRLVLSFTLSLAALSECGCVETSGPILVEIGASPAKTSGLRWPQSREGSYIDMLGVKNPADIEVVMPDGRVMEFSTEVSTYSLQNGSIRYVQFIPRIAKCGYYETVEALQSMFADRLLPEERRTFSDAFASLAAEDAPGDVFDKRGLNCELRNRLNVHIQIKPRLDGSQCFYASVEISASDKASQVP